MPMALTTTSATRRCLPAAKTSAFTLLEILLVLALIGLHHRCAGGGGVRCIQQRSSGARRGVLAGVSGGPETGVAQRERHEPEFDGKGKKLVWSNGRQTDSAALTPRGATSQVQFIQATKGGSLILIAGVVETQEVPRVMFYPDGTCMAFRVQFRSGRPLAGGHRSVTCAPVLEKTDDKS